MGRSEDRSCYPHIHFAAHFGWINDPNGLVYHDGIYEMYYQCNPQGVEWGNMTWGHARSRDLVNWEEMPPVLHPDENGAMYSGCGLRNDRALLGMSGDTLFFFYTAAPSRAERKNGKEFTIRFAYSTDGGDTLIKTGDPVLASAERENRDPKVFWHEESKAYIMLLWLKGNEFSIWRSKDLKQFTLTQRLVLDGGFECPDLMKLPMIDESGRDTGEFKWLFWEAAGNYYLGDFDGYTFTQTQEKMNAYANPLPYAAQTWYGTPDEKTLSLSWLRTACISRQTTGVMALPREFSLVEKGEKLILKQSLPSIVTDKCGGPVTLSSGAAAGVSDKAIRFTVDDDGAEGYQIDLFSSDSDTDPMLSIIYRKSDSYLVFICGEISHGQRYSFDPRNSWDIVYDRGIIEMSTGGDTFLYIDDIPQLRTKVCTAVRISGEGVKASAAEFL